MKNKHKVKKQFFLLTTFLHPLKNQQKEPFLCIPNLSAKKGIRNMNQLTCKKPKFNLSMKLSPFIKLEKLKRLLSLTQPVLGLSQHAFISHVELKSYMKSDKPKTKKIKRGGGLAFAFELASEELEAKEKALRILEQEANEKEKNGELDLFPERYTKEDEGKIEYERLFKQGILKDGFSEIYFGWFKSKDAFAYYRLHGSYGLYRSEIDYRDYSDAIFKDQFVFANGHVFLK